MTESSPAGEPLAVGRCPWCSAPLEDTSVTTCPSCGAALQEQVEGDLPGLTQIDAMALATQRRARGGGVRALIGLTDEDTEGSPARAVPEPPSEAVRREMLRLRIGALDAEIEAKAAALEAARVAEAAGGAPPPEPTAEPTAEPETEPAPPGADPAPPDAPA
jgi:hypothetical protein